ncbi:MAG: lysoplasmalogenase [Spirosomataceae bacterium]
MNTRLFTIIYFTIAAIEIIADTMHQRLLVYCTKPLLLISLAIYYYLNVSKPKLTRQDKVMLAALIFSLGGDVLLMIREYNLFIFGLGSFLIAHICYIVVFSKKIKLNNLARIILMVYVFIFIYYLRGYVPSGLFVPVLLYALTIATMGIKAFERQAATKKSYQFVAIGAVLFIISDSLIAINKFIELLPQSTLLIMGTYVLAQYLIVNGVLEENKSKYDR